jgi:hypothetical protein
MSSSPVVAPQTAADKDDRKAYNGYNNNNDGFDDIIAPEMSSSPVGAPQTAADNDDSEADDDYNTSPVGAP